ncbi:hypothetical protein ALNOE001_13880 [Candidatus Methanobinarius endosymbioticus]|uniref:Uncharacterized protein n=1 Tax=Candidatus Methanobinarius endosymbioticus TaxID=2006182 RepID=A0A366M9Q1_9EURY|nr:hypothetical protein ALNOE001_13880 [Candidatus Methanobinarius endosymbioticus]
MKTIIERGSKNKLKLTRYTYDKVWDDKTEEFLNRFIKKVIYVKSKLYLKDYYLKIYKPIMTKYLTNQSHNCVGIVQIDPERIIHEEIAFALLNNSSGKWNG